MSMSKAMAQDSSPKMGSADDPVSSIIAGEEGRLLVPKPVAEPDATPTKACPFWIWVLVGLLVAAAVAGGTVGGYFVGKSGTREGTKDDVACHR